MKQKLKILVVEDEALTSLMICNELNGQGYDAFNEASTAEEAIRMAKEKAPDFIFMDIHLNGKLDGIDAARSILNQSSIPIAFMTGYPGGAIKDRALQLNPVAFISKPLNVRELKTIIDKETGR
jgi:CheY-like chemotaxis protein